MNERAKTNAAYWPRRWAQVVATGGNYDTMICWSPEEYEDEARKLSDEIIRFTGGDRFGKVLDFGCGRGRFAHLFKDYEGLDIVPEIIEENRKAHPGKIFSLIPNAPEESDEHERQKVGAILAVTVLQHIDDETLKGWLRIFKKSATNLFIIESVGAANAHTYRRDWPTFLPVNGYAIRSRQTFKSREEYDFIWAT